MCVFLGRKLIYVWREYLNKPIYLSKILRNYEEVNSFGFRFQSFRPSPIPNYQILISTSQGMDAIDSVVDPLRDFAKDSIRLVKRCHKPDRNGMSFLHLLRFFLFFFLYTNPQRLGTALSIIFFDSDELRQRF